MTNNKFDLLQETGTGYPVDLPERAYGGNYCRTSSFHHPREGRNCDVVIWREAKEHPLKGKWFIQEIRQQSNTIDPEKGHETVEEIKLLKDQKDLPFFVAIKALATFENRQKKRGFDADAAPEPKDYFKTFAENEGVIIFDGFGNPHPTLNGSIVTDGVFPSDARRKAKETYEARPPQEDTSSLLSTKLSCNFSAAAFDNMDSLLNQHTARGKWKEFASTLEELLKEFKCIQQNWKREDGDHFLSGNRYKEMLTEAKTAAKDLMEAKEKDTGKLFLEEAQQEQINRFFTELELAYKVAAAKYFYIGLLKPASTSDENKEKIEIFREFVRSAEKTCRDLGGSDWDIKRLYAETISGEATECVKDGNGKSYVYYFPEGLLTFAERCKEVIHKYDEAIKGDHSRIKRPEKGTQSPQPKPS